MWGLRGVWAFLVGCFPGGEWCEKFIVDGDGAGFEGWGDWVCVSTAKQGGEDIFGCQVYGASTVSGCS